MVQGTSLRDIVKAVPSSSRDLVDNDNNLEDNDIYLSPIVVNADR